MFSHLLLPPERPRGWRDPAEVVSQSPLSPPLARPLPWAARSSARAHAHTHTIPPPCVHPPPSQVVAVARWGFSVGGGRARGGGGSDSSAVWGARVCAPRAGAAGYRPGIWGSGADREERAPRRRLGRDPRWQRLGRRLQAGRVVLAADSEGPAGRLANWAEEKRGALGVRTPAPSPQLSKLQALFHPPSAPEVNNFFTPLRPRPCLRQPREVAARRGPGTPGTEMWPWGGGGRRGEARRRPGAGGRRGRGDGAKGRELSAPLPPTSSSCGCPFRARSSRSCQAPGPRRCRRRRRRWGLPAPPSRPRRKWTASPGNRCARRRGRSAPRARRSSAARAARRSCTPCPSSKVTSEGAAPGGSAGARPRASRAISSRGFLLPRWGLQCESCFPRCFPPPPPESNRFALQSFADFLFPDSPELFPS